MKPWFRRFKRAVELHFTGSTAHTSRADACADSTLIAFSSSPSFDPAANSVARAFTSCAVSLGSLPESLSELGAGTTFFFFFFGICFAAGTLAGLTNTLGSLRSRPMPTPAAIPGSPFVPRMAQPPYSHVANSTRAELDRLGLTALRAMVGVEPYGSSDLGGDPSDDEPPSMTSASPSEDDDPEDPENPSVKKKKKKRKTRRPEGRRSQEAKAIATSKIVVNLPEFTGKDLSEFAENFGRFLRLTGQTHASERVKCDLLLQCCKTKYLAKQVRQIMTNSATFADVLVALERHYPTYETDLSIRAEIQNLAVLPNNPNSGRVSELLADLDHWAGRLTPGSYSSDDLLFWLVAKLPREL